MRGKGKQFVPHGGIVHMQFPGGGGYGPPGERATQDVARDLARGYISSQTAQDVYGLSAADVQGILAASQRGEDL